MTDYRIDIRVKNGKLMRMMARHGIFTMAELSRRTGIQQSTLGLLANLKLPGRLREGAWRPSVLKLADALNCLPEDLIPVAHEYDPLTVNRGEWYADLEDMKRLVANETTPELEYQNKEVAANLMACLDEIDPRHRHATVRYYGLDGEPPATQREIGDDLGVGVARVGQMLQHTLRKLRNPRRARLLGHDEIEE
jgi:RNA polymerase sigma factor (sigma-70 family)